MIDFDVILETKEVRLRPLQKEDLSRYRQLTNTPSLWTYFTSDLSIDNELEKWIDTACEQILKQQRLAFTIENKANAEIIGSTSLGNISYDNKRVEIGWTWIAKEFHGKGINDQIKYLMLKYCFENIGFERVESKTDVLNIPARKALARIGMTEEGILRSHTLMTHNRRRDTIYYSILRSEWNDIKKKNSWE
ncbi:GNAT family N-acetyltransferase [Sunxiuqinia elliptica]